MSKDINATLQHLIYLVPSVEILHEELIKFRDSVSTNSENDKANWDRLVSIVYGEIPEINYNPNDIMSWTGEVIKIINHPYKKPENDAQIVPSFINEEVFEEMNKVQWDDNPHDLVTFCTEQLRKYAWDREMLKMHIVHQKKMIDDQQDVIKRQQHVIDQYTEDKNDQSYSKKPKLSQVMD